MSLLSSCATCSVSTATAQRRHAATRLRRRPAPRVAQVLPASPGRRSCRRCRARPPVAFLCIFFNWMKIQGWIYIQRPAALRQPPSSGDAHARTPKLTDGSSRSSISCRARSSAPARRQPGPRSPTSSASSPPTPPRSICRRWRARASSSSSAAPRAASVCSLTHCAPAPGARQAVLPALAEPGAALAAADRPGRGRQPDPRPGARRPHLPDGSQHVRAPARLPAEGTRHEHERRRHHGRRPARRAEGERRQERADRRRPPRRRGHRQALQAQPRHIELHPENDDSSRSSSARKTPSRSRAWPSA